MDDTGHPPSDDVRGRPRGWITFARKGAFAGAVAVLLSLVLRALYADTDALSRFNFYLPAALTTPLGLLLVASAWARRWVRAAAGAVVLGLGLWGLHIDQPFLLRNRSAAVLPEDTFRVLTYNVMGYKGDEAAVIKTFVESKADIICIVEGTFAKKAPPKVVKALGKSYQWAVGSRLSIASKFPVKEFRHLVSDNNVTVLSAILDVGGKPLTVLLADMQPPTRRNDDASFSALNGAVANQRGPAILTGDFNVPRGSWQLRPLLSAEWEDSFTVAAHQRWVATWPARVVRLPMWQIDHLFHRGDVIPIQAKVLMEAQGSDHLPVVGEYRLIK